MKVLSTCLHNVMECLITKPFHKGPDLWLWPIQMWDLIQDG